MKNYLEHANINVGSFERAVRFLTTAFPEFKIRGQGGQDGKTQWMHLGTGESYIALSEADPKAPDERRPYKTVGVNHLGFVTADAEALRERMLKAGYREGYVPDPHPHRRRVYILDDDGTEWEFVQYFSDDPKERNDYAL